VDSSNPSSCNPRCPAALPRFASCKLIRPTLGGEARDSLRAGYFHRLLAVFYTTGLIVPIGGPTSDFWFETGLGA
jgi:hypothetical protein